MRDEHIPVRLDRISTSWSLLEQANEGGDTASAARRLLVERYGGAVRRYLGAILRDDAAADDLAQEFALALVQGKLATASPERGRFRDYVRAVAMHLVSAYRRRQKRVPQTVSHQPDVVAGSEDEHAFRQGWRDELLARTWEALNQANPTFFVVLHARATHPDVPLAELVQILTPQLGREPTAESLRQTVHRARLLFADLLLGEVAQSLTQPGQEEIARELEDLNL